MSRTNEKRHIKWDQTCKYKCRLNGSVCNNKQRWNKDKCRCECKESIYKWIRDKWFIWNPSNWECDCEKSCGVAEYLDYERIPAEEYSENIDGNEMINNATLNDYENLCDSWTLYSWKYYFSLLF